MARFLMFHMKVPKHFWANVLLMSYYLINRLPPSILGWDKLDPRAIKCVFLEYSRTHKRGCTLKVYARRRKVCVPPLVMHSQSQEPFENKKMLPPPKRLFQSREALLEHVRSFSITQGYITTIHKSSRDYNVVLGCDRGGRYRNRRDAFGRHGGCPFEMEGRRMPDGSWVIKVHNGEHNHEASEGISAHPYSRHFSDEEISKVKQMTKAGIRPRQILTALKNDNPYLLATARDLYNLKAKFRKEYLLGRAEMDVKKDALLIESASWSSGDTDIFIDLMVEEVEKGNRCTKTFSKKSWEDIQTKFYQKTGCNYTLLQFRNEFKKLRKDYTEFKKLLEVTGFTWDPMANCVTAEDSVWDTYIQADSYASKFRDIGCSHWVELQVIYGDTSGTGEVSLGHGEDPLESEEEDDQIVDLDAQNDDMNVFATQSDDGGDSFLRRHYRTPTTHHRGSKSSAFAEPCMAPREVPRAGMAVLTGASSSTSPSSIVETDPHSISKCMEVLNAMEGVGPDEYVKGVKMFQEPGWREAFMMVPPEKRMWLLQKLS
ncbi:uncharacterized protein LOC143888845 [Tasmannia lanceolata]|uniref:uncharacterized protein LOC143888845 n=1 Tax=Tasmannia lanceolata TaxID=3420 RepID=UPI004063FDE1